PTITATPTPAHPDLATAPTATALVPAISPSETLSTSPETDNRTVQQTVQQPAAERTIVQTAMPAPLTFGQPLPAKAL
ncbi:MAG: hypothetical protein AAFY17_02590, partial [Cyanobacteria bacterium J06642_11]